MNHANTVAEPTGPSKQPRLSVMLKKPPILPRISEPTMLVDATDNERVTWGHIERGVMGAGKCEQGFVGGREYGVELNLPRRWRHRFYRKELLL